MTTRRQFNGAVLDAAALAAGGYPSASHAQGQPDQARILVGFPPGGTTDALSRRVADKLRGHYANTVVVENRSGAGGQIAISALKGAAGDGGTLLLTPSSCLSVYPFTYPRLPYRIEDLAPVTLACSYSLAFGVGPGVPDRVKDVPDYVAWVRSGREGSGSFGSPAAGSIPHLTAALMGRLTKLDLRHVPYRGSAPGIVDLLGGQIPAMCSPVGDYLAHLKTGKLRILGTTGPVRSPFTPDVPTFREQGIDLAVREWYGFFLPASASPEVRRRLAAYLQPALASKEVVESLAQAGMEAQSSTPDHLEALLKADAAQWRGLVRQLGFTADS